MTSCVEVLRGDHVESRHEVSVAVVRADGLLVASSGDPDRPAFLRSCAKPFQAVPLVTSGAAEAFGFATAQLALACASHNGEARHVEVARGMLAAAGATEQDLVCGPHSSLSEEVARAMASRGERPTRAHNNCSGKHAGMIAVAKHRDWGAAGYHHPDHQVQQACLGELARWAGTAVADIPFGIDGCGVPSFVLPLRAAALAFARLGASDRAADGAVPDEARQAGAALFAAMRAEPFLVAGTGRLDTELSVETGGRIVAKIGAEGVYCAAIPDLNLGLALKVEDGALRALGPALLGVLDVVAPGVVPRLEAHRRPAIGNTLGETVGWIEARVDLRHGAS